MKFSLPLLSLAFVSGVVASPINLDRAVDGVDDLQARQSSSLTSNEFTNGGCKSVIVIFARGTAQLGNLVCGP
jgi:cutinase